MQLGEAYTGQRWQLGQLPPVGKWVALTAPIAAMHLDGQLLTSLSFTDHGGMVSWGRSEFLDDGKVQVLLDGALPNGVSFDKGVQWSDRPAQDGKKSHSLGNQPGDVEYHLNDGGWQIDLR